MSYNPIIHDLKNQFRTIAFKNKEETTKNAIEMAYADMSRRQKGHTPAMKEVCVKWLVNEVFTDSLQITNFKTWHEDTCEALIAKMNSVTPGFGTVGKAQKVINMTLKYLSCISNRYDSILDQCHMTLDGYTLDWYKTDVLSGKGSVIPWSKIERYEDYMCIQDKIRKYLKQFPVYSIKIGTKTATAATPLFDSPFDAEFIIWEGNIIKEKYNSIVKALNNYIHGSRGQQAGRQKDSWLIGAIFDDFLRDFCKKL